MIKREHSPAESVPPDYDTEAVRDDSAPVINLLRYKKSSAVVLPSGTTTPRDVFAHALKDHPLWLKHHPTGLKRMVNYSNPDNILVYTSGQIVTMSSKHKRAGCAVVFQTEGLSNMNKSITFSLEKRGPKDKNQHRIEITAALRAVVAALEFKLWGSEGWSQVTIATDNKLLFEGITHHIAKWVTKRWLEEGSKHRPPSRELWCRALNLINVQAYYGCEVKFWLVTAEQNKETADMARTIAPSDSVSATYRPCGNVGSTPMMAL